MTIWISLIAQPRQIILKPPKVASEDDLTPEPSDVDDGEGEEEMDGSEAMVSS